MTTAALIEQPVRPSRPPVPTRAAVRRWWRPALLITGVVLAVVELRGHLPSPASAWAVLEASQPAWLLAAVVLQIVSMGAFAEQQRQLLAAFGVRIPATTAIAVSYARSAMSTALPGGSAVSAGYAFRHYRARGASQSIAAAVMLLSGVASVAGLVLLYAGALLAWTTPSRDALAIAAAVLAVVALAMRRVRPASAASRTGAYAPVPADTHAQTPVDTYGQTLADLHAQTPVDTYGQTTADGHGRTAADAYGRVPPMRVAARGRSAVRRLRRTLGETATLARGIPPGRWLVILALAALNWLTDLVCLLAAVHAVGLTVSASTVATAYLAVQLIRQIPVTPGGIGVIEASLILALTTAGAAAAPAAAAVLIYRLLSCWTILPIGLICWTAQNPSRDLGVVVGTKPALSRERATTTPRSREEGREGASGWSVDQTAPADCEGMPAWLEPAPGERSVQRAGAGDPLARGSGQDQRNVRFAKGTRRVLGEQFVR